MSLNINIDVIPLGSPIRIRRDDGRPLRVPVPHIVSTYAADVQNDIYNYLFQLDELQMKAYCIAYEHLGSSFSILRSNGFKKWCTTQKS